MLLKKRKTTNKGFLLIELLVSFAIITFVILSLTIAVLGMIFTKKQFIMQESAKDISKQIVGSIMKREDNIDKLIKIVCPNSTDCANYKYDDSPRMWGKLVKFKKMVDYTSQDQDLRDLIDYVEFSKIKDRVINELSPNASIQIYVASVTGNPPGTRPLPVGLEICEPRLSGVCNPLISIPVQNPSQITPPGYDNTVTNNTIPDSTDIEDRKFWITSVINYNLKTKSATPLNESNNENTNPTDKNIVKQIKETKMMISQMAEIDKELCDPMKPIVDDNCPICKKKPKYVRCQACTLPAILPANFPLLPIPPLPPTYTPLNDFCPQCYDYRSSNSNSPIPAGGIPKYCRSCAPRVDPNNPNQFDPNQVFSDNCQQCQGSSGLHVRCQKCVASAQSSGTIPKPAGCP